MQTQVLVSGAGPVGLTTAIELARRGVDVQVIDRVPPRAATESRALGVHARTMEVFERLGVAPRMLAAGRPIHGFAYHARGREVAAVHVRGVDAPYPYILLLPQGTLERILLDRLAELGVGVHRPVELVDHVQDADGVRIDTTDGPVDASYLLAADGGRSTIRHQLDVDFPGRAFEGVIHLLDTELRFAGAVPPDHRGNFYAGRDTIVGLGRLHGDVWRVIAYLRDDDPRSTGQPLDAAATQSVLDEHPYLGASVGPLHWRSVYRVSNRMVDRLRHGRVFLAGDAAHIHSPMGGQGLNTGVQDAHNLAWKLAATLDGTADGTRAEALLDSYDAERLPVIAAVVRETALGHRLLSDHGRRLAHPAVAAALTGVRPLMRRVLDQPAVRRPIARTVSQVAVGYRGSPIVRDLSPVPDPSLQAGDRAPDAGGLLDHHGRATRLFPILAADTAHHLLVFAGVTATDAQIDAVGETVRQLAARHPDIAVHRILVRAPGYPAVAPQEGDLHDIGVALHDRHRLTTGGLHLVRPDGYLALRGTDPHQDVEQLLPDALVVLDGRSHARPARRDGTVPAARGQA